MHRPATHRAKLSLACTVAVLTLAADAPAQVFGVADLTRLDTWFGQQAGIKKLDIAFEDGPRLVAATQLSDDRLKLFSFDTFGGTLQHLDSLLLTHKTSQVKIAYVPGSAFGGPDFFVTTSRNSVGKLRLTAFELLADGKLALRDNTTDGDTTDQMAIASVNPGEFAIAVQEPSGFLRVRVYDLNAAGKISPATYNSYGGLVDRVDLQASPGSIQDDLIVGTRDLATDRLMVYVFGRRPGTLDLVWVGDNEASGYVTGTLGGGVHMPKEGLDVVTAIRTASHRLKLIRWAVPDDWCPSSPCPRDVIRAEEGQSGTDARHIRVATAPNISKRYLTAHQLDDGNLRLIAWQRTASDIVKVGNNVNSGYPLGAAKKIALGFAKSGRAVVAVRDGQDRLRLILWHIAW